MQGHVVPTVPYISDAATYSPESCVFGQMINIGSVLCEYAGGVGFPSKILWCHDSLTTNCENIVLLFIF